MKSSFPHYEENVCLKGVTSGHNISSFVNESVEISFHLLLRRKMNQFNPVSSFLSLKESSVSRRRQLPCADAKLRAFALSALLSSGLRATGPGRLIRCCGSEVCESGLSREAMLSPETSQVSSIHVFRLL